MRLDSLKLGAASVLWWLDGTFEVVNRRAVLRKGGSQGFGYLYSRKQWDNPMLNKLGGKYGRRHFK